MRRLILAILLLPTLAEAQPAQDKHAALDKLLDALRTAPTEQVASALEEKIRQSWLGSEVPAVTLLMSRPVCGKSNAGAGGRGGGGVQRRDRSRSDTGRGVASTGDRAI